MRIVSEDEKRIVDVGTSDLFFSLYSILKTGFSIYFHFFHGGSINSIVSDSSITGILRFMPAERMGVIGTLGLALIMISYFEAFL